MTQGVNDRQRWLALLVLCAGVLMIVLDTTIVNVALPSIRSDLGFSKTALVWVVNDYMLTFGSFMTDVLPACCWAWGPAWPSTACCWL